MKKEKKPVFLKAFLLVSFVLLVNIGAFVFLQRQEFSSGLTGMSIKKVIGDSYYELSNTGKIILISQWALLAIFLISAFARDRLIFNTKKEVGKINLEKIPKGSRTDLDTLYKILQNRKQLKLSTITKTFKVKKDIAMGWCKILESGNLAAIDYPTMGSPIVKIIEKRKSVAKKEN